MLNEAWIDQYRRMHRSFDRMQRAGSPAETPLEALKARDAVYHFFQDAFHLKDWIHHSEGVAESELTAVMKRSVALAACRDIAIGLKHLAPKGKPLTAGGKHAEVTGQGVKITVPPIGTTGGSIQYNWTVTANNQPYDALILAAEVVAAWDIWLRAQGDEWVRALESP